MIFQTLAEIVDKIYPKVAEIRRSQKIFIELHRTHPISKQVGENSEVLRKSFQISADVSRKLTCIVPKISKQRNQLGSEQLLRRVGNQKLHRPVNSEKDG